VHKLEISTLWQQMNFNPILKHETCAKCKVCCVFKRESLVYVPKGVEVKEQSDGTYACVHRCKNAGCLMGKNKPMECAAWPFSVSKRGKELLLVLEHTCQYLNKKEKFSDVQNFALEVVAPVLMEYSRQHLDTLREHDERNLVISVFNC
jgi:Pyruvate/2-oxoacid:ferredoxin oxidoreductase delta subunit